MTQGAVNADRAIQFVRGMNARMKPLILKAVQ